MKLATKKFFNNVLAMVVSVCMVCTLTPSVAWATSSSSGGNETTTIGAEEGENAATGSTSIKGKVYDTDFSFVEIAGGGNFPSKSSLETALKSEDGKIKAVFKKADISDFTLEWGLEKLVAKDEADIPEGATEDDKWDVVKDSYVQLAQYTYAGGRDQNNQAILSSNYEGKNLPTFIYPANEEQLTKLLDSVQEKDNYRVVVTATDANNSDNRASAHVVLTLQPDYSQITLHGESGTAPNKGSYMVQGNVYTGFSIPLHYPELTVNSVTPATDSRFQALQTLANGEGEDISDAVQLDLTDMGNLPDGSDPYMGDLNVYVPLPAGSTLEEGNSVRVFGYSTISPATSPTAKKYDATVMKVKDADGNDVLVAAFAIAGTGATLGSFAVGTPMAGSYTVHTSASTGGLINPAGDASGVLTNQPLGRQAEFTALAMTPGYTYSSFEVRIGSATGSMVSADKLQVDGNLLKFSPTAIGVDDGDDVYVHANFEAVTVPGEGQTAPAYNVSASLRTSDGATGELTFKPALTYANAPGTKTVRMGQSGSLDSAVSDYAGVFLQFNPGTDCIVDYVKVNGQNWSFDKASNALMIGALKGATNIEVSYRKVQSGELVPQPTYVNVTGTLDDSDWPTGYIRAMLVIDGVPNQSDTTHAYRTVSGGQQTIDVFHTKNYEVKATQIDANGVHTDVTNLMTKGDTRDSITVYNVTENIEIVFDYVPKSAEIGGIVGPGGDGEIIVDPTQQQSSRTKMRAFSAMRNVDVRAGSTTTLTTESLEVGNRARIKATPRDGYELGRIEVNGTNVTQYFVPHTRNGVVSYWTLTIYRSETGEIPPDTGKWLLKDFEDLGLYDTVVDNVIPIESSTATVSMDFNPKVPTSAAYQMIRTHVEGSGGTITPSFKVEQNTTATVQFFPDDTYKVAAYKIDNGSWVTAGNDRNSLKCQVPVGELDHDVYVRFEAGSIPNMPKSYTITPQASAGGTISPGEPVKVYEGDTFNFSILPKTGYTIATYKDTDGQFKPDVHLRDGNGTVSVNGYTCTVSNVTSDCRLEVQFDKDDVPQPTHVVSVDYNSEGGTVNVGSAFTVANGSNASFTFWPKSGWYVKGVYVITGATPESGEISDPNEPATKDRGINLVGSVVDGRMFTLNDVQDDTRLEVEFAKLSGPTDPNTPPALNDDDTFTLSPLDNCDLGEGATLSPNLADMKFLKAKDSSGNVINPVHAASGADITVIVASGYSLNDEAENGGISIKNGSNDVTDKVTVKPAGDGLYEVTIPADNVTPDMKIVVSTKKDSASQGVVDKAKVGVSKTGEGTVSPAGTVNTSTGEGILWVEAGKSQTFSFIPAKGWKLHRVYVDGATVNVTGNSYTMHNIQGEKVYGEGNYAKVQAVFTQLEDGEQQPVVPTHTVRVVANGPNGSGTVSPSEPTQVADGASLSILAEPGNGFKALAYDGTTQTAGKEIPIVGNTIELSNIKADRIITVFFVPDQATNYVNLNVGYGAGGKASPAGNMLLASGATQTISIIPDAGKAVKQVWLTRGNNTTGDPADSATLRATADRKGIAYTVPAASGETKMAVYIEFCDASDSGKFPGLPTGDDLRDGDGNTTYHSVTALVAGGGGSVMPTYSSVANGSSLTITMVPLDGYHLQDAQLGGRSVKNSLSNNGTTYTIPSVTSDLEFRAVFEKNSGATDLDQYYTVFANAVSDGSLTTSGQKAGGTISPAGPVTVSGGGNQSFTIAPDPNCKVSSIVVKPAGATEKGTTISDFKGTSYTLFNVDKDTNFIVTFTALKTGETPPPTVLTHSITATSSLNGSISPSGVRTVDNGGNAMFTFVPWDGYKLSYAVVDGRNVPASSMTNNQYTFASVTEDHTIHAVFIGENEQAADFVSMNITSNRNGTVTPSGSVLVTKGSSMSIDVVPFLSYEVKDISVGGTSIKSSLSGADFTNGTVGNSSSAIQWSHGVLTLRGVTDAVSEVQVTFGVNESYNPGGSGDEGIPDYEKVDVNVQPAGSGSTSIQPNPIHIEKPGAGAKPEQKTMDISIIPEEGKIADKIVVNYGDETSTTYDSSTNPSANEIYQRGYITVDATRGDVDLDITFRDLTDAEKGSLTPATYFDVEVTHSNGGTVGSSGTVKVAKGSSLTLQMIPSNSYEVASVTVNGENRTSEVTNTRTFILKNVQANQKVNVAFGFVSKDEDAKTHSFKASAVGDVSGGAVSPLENKVRDGASQVVYFMPKAGYKVGNVRVLREGLAAEDFPNYNSATMTVRDIKANVSVEAEFVKADAGEPTWTVDSVSLTVEVGAGKGQATPAYSEVPVGSSTDVSFYPEPEWRASYYTLNGKTTYLPETAHTWPVMPDTADGAENKMVVFFERIDGNGADQVVNVQLVRADGESVAHGSASPAQAKVAYGGSTTFYLFPESGYTVDYVRFNGTDQVREGVINVGISNKQNISSNGNSVTPLGQPSLVTESDANSLPSKGNVYYSAYTVTLNDVVTSGTLEVKYKKIPSCSGVRVDTAAHKMTVTSMGGGTVSPLGELYLPEGEELEILTSSFENYYLASVIQKSENPTTTTDLTGKVEGRIAKARMGSKDCTVEVTFERVGVPGPPVYVSMGKATYNGKDIPVQVGGYIDPKTGELKPLKLNDDGVLCDSDGNPIEFTRGGAYEFYFNPEVSGDDGRGLVIESAKYDGTDLSVIPGANYLTNVVLNSSGAFDLTFRQLDENEQPVSPSKGYTVTIMSFGNGTVSPAGPLTRQPGGETGPLALRGNDENFAVSKVTVSYADEWGSPVEEEVPSTEYADGTYNRKGIDRDIMISVYFDEFSIVRVEWDNSLGFITPNHAEGSYIYRPVGTAELPFAVAPYADSELVSIVTGETADTAAPIDYTDDPWASDQLYGDLGMAKPGEENGGISTFSMADNPNVVVRPESTDFSNVYGFVAPLGKTTYVRANFKSTRVEAEHTIKAEAKGHGTVSPAGEVKVNHGASQTFTATAEAGYTVTGLVVDGNKVSPASSYTFNGVIEDHTIVFEFGLPQAGGGSGFDRLVRVASSLARTGDLTGPVVGLFLLIAAAGLTVTAVSYIRRRNRRRQRYQQ